jgi:penicillin-binding protein 2
VAGNNLTLTSTPAAAHRRTGLRRPRGALVAIEPSTGGILALVSVPNYDPNLFVDGIDTQNWDALNSRPTSRCSIAPSMAPTRPVRPSSPSWRWVR